MKCARRIFVWCVPWASEWYLGSDQQPFQSSGDPHGPHKVALIDSSLTHVLAERKFWEPKQAREPRVDMTCLRLKWSWRHVKGNWGSLPQTEASSQWIISTISRSQIPTVRFEDQGDQEGSVRGKGEQRFRVRNTNTELPRSRWSRSRWEVQEEPQARVRDTNTEFLCSMWSGSPVKGRRESLERRNGSCRCERFPYTKC